MTKYFIYFLTCKKNTTLYIGVTNDLKRRLLEHQEGKNTGFTKRYNLHKLVYYEQFPEIYQAIAREKQLKHWERAWKDDLINSSNPNWLDLSEDIIQENP